MDLCVGVVLEHLIGAEVEERVVAGVLEIVFGQGELDRADVEEDREDDEERDHQPVEEHVEGVHEQRREKELEEEEGATKGRHQQDQPGRHHIIQHHLITT